jgi:hypothetical protein
LRQRTPVLPRNWRAGASFLYRPILVPDDAAVI